MTEVEYKNNVNARNRNYQRIIVKSNWRRMFEITQKTRLSKKSLLSRNTTTAKKNCNAKSEGGSQKKKTRILHLLKLGWKKCFLGAENKPFDRKKNINCSWRNMQEISKMIMINSSSLVKVLFAARASFLSQILLEALRVLAALAALCCNALKKLVMHYE